MSLATRLFRTHVCGRPRITSRDVKIGVADGDSEVTHMGGVTVIQQNIARLNVSVHNSSQVREVKRVLKPGGEAIFQVYNRVSWLNALSKLMNVGLEHDDAPVLLKYSIGEFQRLLSGFRDIRIIPERFPVKSRLHGGWKGAVYNGAFVGTFNLLPRPLVRRFGWHLLAFCRK